MVYNIIPVRFGKSSKITASPINYKFDEKQILKIDGIEIPAYYEVDFCNDGDTQTKTMVGNSEGVEIPDEYLRTGLPVKAYIVIFGQTDGAVETRFEITIPVNYRPERTDMSPTPTEQMQIDQILSALNDTLDDLNDGIEHVDEVGRDAEANATLAESWAVGGTGTREDEDNDNAKHYAELAAQGAEESGYAWFDVHDDDGHMYIYISDNLSEDVDFAINEETGHLMITYN